MSVNNGLQRKASKSASAEPARYDTKESCTVIAQRLGMMEPGISGAVQRGEELTQTHNFEFVQEQERMEYFHDRPLCPSN